MGTELLIIAKEGINVPFDIAQDVWFYSKDRDFREFLASELETTLYGLQTKGSIGSSLKASIAYIERLAGTESENQNLPVLLQRLHNLVSDPVKIRSVFTIINSTCDLFELCAACYMTRKTYHIVLVSIKLSTL